MLSARTLPKAIAAYRKPAFDWGPTDRLWHLFNAMNLPLQPRASSNPQQFALTTMRLMAMLGPKVGFDAPPDIELQPDHYEITGGGVDASGAADDDMPGETWED